MKIGETNLVGGTAGIAGSSPAPTDAPAPVQAVAPAERVTTDQAHHLETSVANSVAMAATERGSRLQALTQKVRAGAYQPSASALADEILAAAELDAHLAQALG